MMSMTGYGQGTYSDGELQVCTEMRAVNYRFLDISLRLPPGLMKYEQRLRDLISARIKRGKVDVFISTPSSSLGTSKLVVDERLAAEFVGTLRRLSREYALSGDVSVGMIADFRPAFSVETSPEAPDVWEPIRESVTKALAQLQEMRAKEGASLLAAISRELEGFKQDLKEVERLVRTAEQRIGDRILEFVRNQCSVNQIDRERLEQEVALLLVKTDVSEELARLSSHLAQFEAFTKREGPVGKRLTFICQELLREVNTISSKAQSKEVASKVIEMKSRIESIREQLNNIE